MPALRQKIRELVAGKLPWPLFIHGPCGTGKSCAALALLDHLDGTGAYFTASQFADLAIAADKGKLGWRDVDESLKQDSAVGPQSLQRYISRLDLVVLDEMATREKVADWHYEKIKNLFDWRKNMPVIAVSNHGLDGITRMYDDRIASRLSAGTVVELQGSDRRLRTGTKTTPSPA